MKLSPYNSHTQGNATNLSAPCVAQIWHSVRLTYHQFLSPYGRRNWVKSYKKSPIGNANESFSQNLFV